MIITVYNSKGGVGKTPISTNIVLDKRFALGTNDQNESYDSFISEDSFLKVDMNEEFAEIPKDVSIVFDLAGSISGYSKSISSAVLQSDVILVPITQLHLAKKGGVFTIQDILELKPDAKIIVLATDLEKKSKEIFKDNEWNKSAGFLEIENLINKNFNNIKTMPIKHSRAFINLYNKEKSIQQLMNSNALDKRHYKIIADHFNELYKKIGI